MPEVRSSGAKKRKSTSAKSSPPSRDTRLLLLDSGQMHFARRGFAAASVHDIARDASVNVSLVSYHFGGKEGLFRACLERAGLDRLGSAERVLSADPTTIDELRVRLGMFIDEMLIDGINNPEIFAILYRDLHDEFHLVEDVFQKTFLRCFELLANFLAAAKSKGLIKSWVDPALTAYQMMGVVVHTIRTDHMRKRLFGRTIAQTETRIETRDHLVKSLLEGLWNNT